MTAIYSPGVPTPKAAPAHYLRRGRPKRWRFEAMAVGESFTIPLDSAGRKKNWQAARSAIRRHRADPLFRDRVYSFTATPEGWICRRMPDRGSEAPSDTDQTEE